MRPVTFVLDADVLIAMQRFCFTPARLGARAEVIRDLLVNISGRDVLPGPALAQLYQPSRAETDTRAALEAYAALDLLRPLSRAEIMDEHRPPAVFDPAYARNVTGLGAAPQMLWTYAGVLRLRQLWSPDQTLPQRAQSFESFMQWLRDDLRLNAALLVQVAFNLWMSDDNAKRQASRLLHFRADVTDATLRQLWGTAYDLVLVAGHADAMQLPEVIEAVILTFDRGLAGMRDFFEHVEPGEVANTVDVDPRFGWNARLRMNFHPGLEHTKPRVAQLATHLQADMFERLAQPATRVRHRADVLAIVEREEHRLLAVAR
jgi:hypothetical protein